jgi:hypothetical protein
MKMTRLPGIALIAIFVAIGTSSCCSVMRYLTAHGIGWQEGLEQPAQPLSVTLILRHIATPSFIEWKVASDRMCTQSTGRITQDTEAFEQTWEVGGKGQHIWFWWDTLYGEADATVLVGNVVVFQGHCAHYNGDKVRMIDTCSNPRVYKTFGAGPYLREPVGRKETDLLFTTSKLPRRYGTMGYSR